MIISYNHEKQLPDHIIVHPPTRRGKSVGMVVASMFGAGLAVETEGPAASIKEKSVSRDVGIEM